MVERDYVLGWLLSALARNPEVKSNWVFKGGTCLKKCFFETYRFSEDLDFSLRPAAAYSPEALLGVLKAVAQEAHDLSGIEFRLEEIQIVDRRNKQGLATYQAKLPYRGPLGQPKPTNIQFDLTQHELIVDEADEREASHPYPDDLPDGVAVVTYSIEELFAEKTRALHERTRPRDLYDVVQMVENHGESIDFDLARTLFRQKCLNKSITPPTAAALLAQVLASEELMADWENMLAQQLPVLPPIQAILDRLGPLLAWLDEPQVEATVTVAAQQAPAPLGAKAAGSIIAPPSLTFWGTRPLEKIRFAGSNRVMVAFSYSGKARVAEPYALRRAAAGHVILYAWVRGDQHIKAFKLDEIQGLTVTNEPFSPRYAIEVTGEMIPGLRSSGRKTRRGRSSFEIRYVFRCPSCEREFRHERNRAALRPHKDAEGYDCRGRRGYLERTE